MLGQIQQEQKQSDEMRARGKRQTSGWQRRLFHEEVILIRARRRNRSTAHKRLQRRGKSGPRAGDYK